MALLLIVDLHSLEGISAVDRHIAQISRNGRHPACVPQPFDSFENDKRQQPPERIAQGAVQPGQVDRHLVRWDIQAEIRDARDVRRT